jgi:hypothetical protein
MEPEGSLPHSQEPFNTRLQDETGLTCICDVYAYVKSFGEKLKLSETQIVKKVNSLPCCKIITLEKESPFLTDFFL